MFLCKRKKKFPHTYFPYYVLYEFSWKRSVSPSHSRELNNKWHFLYNLKAVYASVFSRTAELRKKKEKKNRTELRNIVFNADIQCYTVSNRVEHIKDYMYKNLAKIYNHRKKALGLGSWLHEIVAKSL